MFTMKFAVGFLCVLSALIPPGFSLSCKACYQFGDTNCNGPSVQCSPGSVCGSLFLESEFPTYNGILRSCFEVRDCRRQGTFTVSGIRANQFTSCCKTDNCEPLNPRIPFQSDNKHNGVKCPSSFSKNNVVLPDMECTGMETHCFTQSVGVTGSSQSSLVLRGCATHSICSFNHIPTSNTLNITSNVVCGKQNNRSPTPPLDGSNDVTTTASNDVTTTARNDVTTTTRNDVTTTARNDVPMNGSNDVTTTARNDVTTNGSNDVTTTARNDVTTTGSNVQSTTNANGNPGKDNGNVGTTSGSNGDSNVRQRVLLLFPAILYVIINFLS